MVKPSFKVENFAQVGGRRRSRGGRRTRTVRRGGRKTARRGGRKTVRRGGRRTAKRGGRFGVPAVLFLSQKALQKSVGRKKGKKSVLGKVSKKFNKLI